MNTQEILNKIEQLPSNLIEKKVVISKDSVVELVRKLDERSKVKIPQFVAEHIEKCKRRHWSIRAALTNAPEEVEAWLCGFKKQDTFALAWLDGYEVEQEKKYRVKIADDLVMNDTLSKNETSGIFTFGLGDGSKNELFTKQELEDEGFGGVFGNSMFEVEEVE